MLVSIPPAGTAPLNIILDTIRRAFASAVSIDEAAPRLLLRSPNGTIYSLTVDDAGNVSTVVKDGTRP
jgi:hypothetical protein